MIRMGLILFIGVFWVCLVPSCGSDVVALGCAPNQKLCKLDTGEMACVGKDNPNYGCARDGCLPCAPDHVAVAGCDPVGSCAIGQCVSAYQDCDKNPDNGCETRTDSDLIHCGMCSTDCETIWHTTPGAVHVLSIKCINSLCRPNACETGWTDCDTALTNGCENNCGVCCPTGQTCNTTTQMCQ